MTSETFLRRLDDYIDARIRAVTDRRGDEGDVTLDLAVMEARAALLSAFEEPAE